MTLANIAGPPGSANSRGSAYGTFDVLRRLLQRPELASLGGLVAAFVVFSILRPDLFLSQYNGVNVASLAAQYGIVAVGVTLLMIAGHFDLSVGAIVGLTGWAMYYFGNVLGLPPVVTLLGALGFGARARSRQRRHPGAHGAAVVHHHPGDVAGLSRRPDDEHQRISGCGQVSRVLRAGDRGQASVRLSHVAALVPCGRGARHVLPAAHPHGELDLRHRAESHRGQESRRAGRSHDSCAIRLVGLHIGCRRGRRGRTILLDRREPRRWLGAHRDRDDGHRRHVAHRGLRQRSRHRAWRVHVRHGQCRPPAGRASGLLGQHLPRRRCARCGVDQPDGH